MKKLSEDEKKVLIMWLVVAVIVFSLLAFIGIQKLTKEEKKYELEKDYSRFYMVNNVINKYYSYISSKKYSNVYNMLSKTYKEKNSISVNNINEYIENDEVGIAYNTSYMCSKEIENGVYSYYVKGNKTNMNTGELIETKNYIVVLNGNKMVFDITPINDEEFGGICYE